MTKSIDTLTQDIYHVLDHTEEHEPNADLAAEYAMRVGGEFAKATLLRDKPREKGRLWASDIGKPCMRQHWFNFNAPELGEQLMGHTKFKFLYGNILEEAVLYMAEEAGHSVEYPQERIEITRSMPTPNGQTIWTVSGRIDAVLDGVLIDVKSTSNFGFKRYKDGINHANDSFGYLWQLGFYKAYNNIPESIVECGFVWIDKQNGHIQYTEAAVPNETEIEQRISDIVNAVDAPTSTDVPRAFSDKPYGKSGNRCLDTACSYCPFKDACWANLRTFAYNHGPVYMTQVTREPNVPEIK